MQRARGATLTAAAALGMAGTIALAFQSTVSNNEAVQGRSGADSQHDPMPDVEPTGADEATRTGLAPTAFAEPKPLEDRMGDDTRTSRTEAHAADTPTAATPTAAPTDASTSPARSAMPDRVESPAHDEARTADATAPADGPDEQQPEDRSSQDRGLVNDVLDVVDSVAGTADSLVGGIGDVLLGG